MTCDKHYSIERVQEYIYKNDMRITRTMDDIPYKPRHPQNQRKIFMDLVLELEAFIEIACIGYRLYRKEGNAYNYPHAKSHLPESCKKGFIKAEFNRILARCKYIKDVSDENEIFTSNLIKRGYTKHQILKIKERPMREKKKSKKKQRWITMKYVNTISKSSLIKQVRIQSYNNLGKQHHRHRTNKNCIH